MRFRKTPRFLLLTALYVGFINLAYVASLLLRFEGEVPAWYWAGYFRIGPLFTVLSLAGYMAAGLFHGLWRYASTVTLFQVLKGVTFSALSLVAIMFFAPEDIFPRSLIVMIWVWQLLFVGGARFAWRLSKDGVIGPQPRGKATRTLVVGADNTGVHLIHEMRRHPAGAEALIPVGYLDEDIRLTGHMLEGVRVHGTIADLPRVLAEQRAGLVIVSNPELPAKVVREIARFCAEAGVRIKTLPGLSDLHPGRPALAQVRDVQIEDLLGREPVQLDLDEVAGFIRDKRVLVTGAGGSIGSELARQAAEFGPRELVLLDHSENGLYFVHHELIALYPRMAIVPMVGDVQDPEGIERLFARFRPELVFHAAAHKHVPLLEINPREAVFNNVVGMRVLVAAADRHGVENFVLISTDKAVNPTSVMGASKRVCEMIGQSRSQHSRTRFIAVRFGNVLGSDGSVIPLFRRQIERGGPITVTHPDARRYFMTIPEAVRLVLQAGAMGKGGEVFLLDMGEQVRILDLARQLIRLAGLREGVDVEIVFTGLRPGEKLYEELHSVEESTRITHHERILVWNLATRDEAELLGQIDELVVLARRGDPEAVKAGLARLVPEYREPTHAPFEIPADNQVIELPDIEVGPLAETRTHWSDQARRAADVVAAATLLTASSVLWGALWIEARMRGEREFLVRETRIGRNTRRRGRRRASVGARIDRRTGERRGLDLLGRPFVSVRFRSDLGPLSRWLGRRGLDRIPQLVNVMRKEMALVGPRPETADTILQRRGLVPDYARRFSVLPGVTGLAQVSECSEADTDGIVRRAHYDLYYVDNHSWGLDARTLSRSFGVVMGRPRLVRPAGGSRAKPGGAPETPAASPPRPRRASS
jgi:FlaA1/EpsC-like NDP-sugar epimerase/lipopolysaccharide/colanic/teichoic acid biosynthesis glycosyltransferase